MRAIPLAIALLFACSPPPSERVASRSTSPASSSVEPVAAAAESSTTDRTRASEGRDAPSVAKASAAVELPSEPDEPVVAAPGPVGSFEALAADLRALPPDPAPEHTTNDTHYLASNERRHDLFRPELDALGGVMLGVGSDQTYVMAPWAKTELLVIVDFDQKVVDLHAIHGALIGASPTAEAFRRLWSQDGAAEAHVVIRDATDDAERRAELLALYDEAREDVDARLRKLTARYAELGVHSYLDTPAQYRYLADLHARGRVVALRGDFTQPGVLRQVARVLGEHGQTVSLLYLSNIEQYFTYRRPFKDNMLALPFDEASLVLRTLPGRPAGFQYIMQRGDDFHAWMRAPRVWSVYGIRPKTKGEPLDANVRFVAGPPPAPSLRSRDTP